jgi:putative oxidoreductase
MSIFPRLLSTAPGSLDAASLVLRLVFCLLMIYQHAFVQVSLFGESPESFPDPLGIGSTVSFYLVVAAQLGCALFVLLGFMTRLALLPLLFTMTVALIRVHWDNPLSDKELPLLYLGVFLALYWLGPGKWSIDRRRELRRQARLQQEVELA